jgi:hypothetical protein
MTADEARRTILEQWRSLPAEQRQTEFQAALFARKIKDDYPFDHAGNRLALIVGWLLEDMD